MYLKFDLSAKAAMAAIALLLIAGSAYTAAAQDSVKVLEGSAAKVFVPTGFYFEGQSAPTQMRNSGVATLGEKRHVIVGLVDTSGYSADVAAKYEGFFITDSDVEIGGKKLETGAYGFGFTRDGKINIHDIGGKTIVTAETRDDADLKRPRPLMLMVVNGELRFYKGRTYAVVAAD
jgi:ethanolamine utilization protein EutA (predicted chaperonin)